MSEQPEKDHSKSFEEKIAKEEKRKMKARKEPRRSIWSGLGLFGMVGWSVAVPALLGAASGIWLDRHYPEKFSWTLTLLITGTIAGCLIAWFWVEREGNENLPK